ncbi:UDP-N-acetylmuramate dehydrogenase [Marinobacteraceae bacterium S3BR75-40.1]
MSLPNGVQEAVDLQRFNTLAVPATAKYFATLDDEKAIPALWQWARDEQLPILVLGGGSNLVMRGDFEGLVLHNQIRGRVWQPLDHHEAILALGSGENWHESVLYAARSGYRGIENLALIPGSVGAAPVQNIGAYGVELSETLVDLDAFDMQTGQWCRFSNSECEFAYRQSRFKAESARYLITKVRLKLGRDTAFNIKYKDLADYLKEVAEQSLRPMAVVEAVMAIRRSKLPDPATLPNVGSFFQNPVVDEAHYGRLKDQFPDLVSYPVADGYKLAAGWMIDHCGWKGYRNGRVGVHSKQALVLVNTGGTGQDILDLAATIAEDVRKTFGVDLAIEPRIVP